MSTEKINELVAYHRKQAELNHGKAECALARAQFHEETIKALLEVRQ